MNHREMSRCKRKPSSEMSRARQQTRREQERKVKDVLILNMALKTLGEDSSRNMLLGFVSYTRANKAGADQQVNRWKWQICDSGASQMEYVDLDSLCYSV